MDLITEKATDKTTGSLYSLDKRVKVMIYAPGTREQVQGDFIGLLRTSNNFKTRIVYF